MIVTVPVYLSDRTVDAKVEIQIRTVAMDFWARLFQFFSDSKKPGSRHDTDRTLKHWYFMQTA